MKKWTQDDLVAVNEALFMLRQDVGVPSVDDLENSSEPLPVKVRSAFEPARLAVLQAHPWTFARVIRCVAGASYSQADGSWRISRPPDALRISAVRSSDGSLAAWQSVDRVLVCDCEPVSVSYLRDVDDLALWPPDVRRAFVLTLARDLALPVTGRRVDFETLTKAAQDCLAQASKANANEDNPRLARWGAGRYTSAYAKKPSSPLRRAWPW